MSKKCLLFNSKNVAAIQDIYPVYGMATALLETSVIKVEAGSPP